MSSFSIASLCAACIFGGSLLGMKLQRLLPGHHLSKEMQDLVKLSAGTIATLTALVLGLLVSSAKSSFDAINTGIEQDRQRREGQKHVLELKKRFELLTPREREVFALVVTGRPNKQVAAELGLSEMTVKVHRSQITKKMRATSIVELARIADRLGLSADKSQ